MFVVNHLLRKYGIIFMLIGVPEAVTQLILTTKKSLLLGFKALFVFLFLAFLYCWTASVRADGGGDEGNGGESSEVIDKQ